MNCSPRRSERGIAAATAGKLEWLLGLAKAELGKLPIADISAGEILRVLRPLEAAGKLETAKRLRAVTWRSGDHDGTGSEKRSTCTSRRRRTLMRQPSSPFS